MYKNELTARGVITIFVTLVIISVLSWLVAFLIWINTTAPFRHVVVWIASLIVFVCILIARWYTKQLKFIVPDIKEEKQQPTPEKQQLSPEDLDELKDAIRQVIISLREFGKTDEQIMKIIISTLSLEE